MLTVLFLAALAFAQAPQAAPQTPAPAAATKPAEQPPQEGSAYVAEGRRDPFVSLVGRGNDPKRAGERAPGVPGLLVSEVTVKGIIRDRAGFIAMIQSPDNKTYIVRHGDQAPGRGSQDDHAGQRDLLAGRQRSAVAREAAGSAEAGPRRRRPRCNRNSWKEPK